MFTRPVRPLLPRLPLRWALALALAAGSSAPAVHAQVNPPAAVASTELQLVPHAFGRATVTGLDGAHLGSVGWIGSDLSILEQHSSQAAQHVRVFKRERTLGSALLAVGTALAVSSLYGYVDDGQFGADRGSTAAYLAGGTALVVGLVRLDVAYRHLRDAVSLSGRD